MDWDNYGPRAMTLTFCGGTGSTQLFAPVAVSGYSGGTWIKVRFRGNLNFKTKASAGNAVISAICFD